MTARSARVSMVCLMIGLIVCAVCVAAMVPQRYAAAYDAYYQGADSFDDSVFTGLDYGLYWYGEGSRVPVRAGAEGANFDPDKPTIIFTHGMKITEGYNRRDLVSLWYDTNNQFRTKGYDSYMYYDQYYQVLLDMGYNVGHFYWNQLAEISIDEDYRIWSSDIYDADGNDVGLNYFVAGSRGERTQGDPSRNPTDSVSILYGEALKAGLGADYDKPWRLVGHSMGGQLTLAVTQNLIYQNKEGLIGDNLLPERITLVDPYICNTRMKEGMRIDHLGGKEVAEGTWTGELCADALEDIAERGIAVDAYGGMQAVYRNYYTMTELVDFLMAEEDDPDYLAAQERCRRLSERISQNACWTHLDALQKKYGAVCHCMIIDYFFTTMYEPEQTDNFGTVLPSLTDSADYIRSLRGFSFVQKAKAGGTENPFYRHTTDFVRADPFLEPIEAEQSKVVYGVAPGYDSVVLQDAETDEVLQTASLNDGGEYHFYGLSAGNYVLRFSAYDAKATGNLIIPDSNPRQVYTFDMRAAEVNKLPSAAMSWVYLMILPAVAIIVMVLVIVLSKRAIKRAKARQ